jgi:hypothetical protein
MALDVLLLAVGPDNGRAATGSIPDGGEGVSTPHGNTSRHHVCAATHHGHLIRGRSGCTLPQSSRQAEASHSRCRLLRPASRVGSRAAEPDRCPYALAVVFGVVRVFAESIRHRSTHSCGLRSVPDPPLSPLPGSNTTDRAERSRNKVVPLPCRRLGAPRDGSDRHLNTHWTASVTRTRAC